jgi:hypothetical protein
MKLVRSHITANHKFMKSAGTGVKKEMVFGEKVQANEVERQKVNDQVEGAEVKDKVDGAEGKDKAEKVKEFEVEGENLEIEKVI